MKGMNDDEMIEDSGTDEESLENQSDLQSRQKTTKEIRDLKTIGISLSDAEKNLTEFQRKLVHNIVYKSMTKHVAARDAGSQAKTKEGLANLAWETLRKPHVAAYMNYLMEKKNELAGVDKVEVIEGLRDVIQRCLTDSKYKEAIKAYELLGAAIGLFKSVSQSTTIKKGTDETSSLLDDSEGDEGAKKDLTKLISMISSTQPSRKK